MTELTKQEVFDEVARHLLTQNKRSQQDNCCLYRGPDGLMCAAGCLIADEHYDESTEHSNTLDRAVQASLRNSGVPLDAISLVGSLQDVHDEFLPEQWHDALSGVANRYELNVDVLKEFSNDR